MVGSPSQLVAGRSTGALEEAPLGTDAEGGAGEAAESLSRGFGRCCTKVPSSLVPSAMQWLGGSDLELWVFPIQ